MNSLSPNIKSTRIILIGLVGLYILFLTQTPSVETNWLNKGSNTFLVFNLLGILSVIALCVVIAKFHTYGKLFFPIFAMGGSWLLALMSNFYMPIASMTNPPMNWGYAREFNGFVHVLSRGQYESTRPTDSFARLIDQIVNLFLDGAREEFTLLFLAVALTVLFFYRKMQHRERSWIVGLSSIFMGLSLLLLILLNPGTDQLSKDLTKVFFTASHLMIAMGIGYGLALIATAIITNYEKVSVFYSRRCCDWDRNRFAGNGGKAGDKQILPGAFCLFVCADSECRLCSPHLSVQGKCPQEDRLSCFAYAVRPFAHLFYFSPLGGQ